MVTVLSQIQDWNPKPQFSNSDWPDCCWVASEPVLEAPLDRQEWWRNIPGPVHWTGNVPRSWEAFSLSFSHSAFHSCEGVAGSVQSSELRGTFPRRMTWDGVCELGIHTEESLWLQTPVLIKPIAWFWRSSVLWSEIYFLKFWIWTLFTWCENEKVSKTHSEKFSFIPI